MKFQDLWKDIKGYEGLYQISNLGSVKSFHKRKGSIIILKKVLQSNGYYTITLCKNNIHKVIYIHKLVAENFIPNPHNYNVINHKDENKLNNNVNNLEWCTTNYNLNYGTRNERCSQNQIRKPVLQFNQKGILVKKWESINSVKNINLKPSLISKCCKEKVYLAYNYIWIYENEYNSMTDIQFKNNIEYRIKMNIISNKSVKMYNINGEYIKTFKSIKEGSEYIHSDTSKISNCCSGKIKTVKGYVWRYENDNINKYDFTHNTTSKIILQYDKEMNFIKEWESQASIKKELNLNIQKALKNKVKTAGGYIWRYKL